MMCKRLILVLFALFLFKIYALVSNLLNALFVVVCFLDARRCRANDDIQ